MLLCNNTSVDDYLQVCMGYNTLKYSLDDHDD